ncbi:MAG: hypothetical protein U1F05_13645 [Burkholderiales bacterium]
MRTSFSCFIAFVSVPCFGAINLAAEEAPAELPWDQPATISYTRNGDGTSSAKIDAVLTYKTSQPERALPARGAYKSKYSAGLFLHRDTTASAPTNDRGGYFRFGGTYVPDFDNSQGVVTFDWAGKMSIGTTLVDAGSAGDPKYVDRTKDRQVVFGSVYYQPPLPGTPTTNPRPMVMYFVTKAGMYSDHSSGGTTQGRVTGHLAEVTASVAPLGLDPEQNKLGRFGFVPTITLAAQVQKDRTATGVRSANTYKLYSASLGISFSKLEKESGGLVPSINLTRSVGADLLTGRARQSKTELTLGFTF